MLFVSAAREILKREVWAKARAIPGADPATWRKDAEGHVICFGDYRNHNSPYCWVMHHRTPRYKGGSDSATNLTPLNTGRLRHSQNPKPWSRMR